MPPRGGAPRPCKECGGTHRPATALEHRVAQEFCVDYNHRAAHERAVGGTRNYDSTRVMFSKPVMKCLVAQATSHQLRRLQITSDRILARLLDIAEFDLSSILGPQGNVLPVGEWPEASRRAVAGLDVDEIRVGAETVGRAKKIKLSDKVRALELLGKNLALWRDVTEHRLGDLSERLNAARQQAAPPPPK